MQKIIALTMVRPKPPETGGPPPPKKPPEDGGGEPKMPSRGWVNTYVFPIIKTKLDPILRKHDLTPLTEFTKDSSKPEAPNWRIYYTDDIISHTDGSAVTAKEYNALEKEIKANLDPQKVNLWIGGDKLNTLRWLLPPAFKHGVFIARGRDWSKGTGPESFKDNLWCGFQLKT